MMKKCIWGFVVGVSACTAIPVSGADNVILFIGRGMGTGHIQAGRAYAGGSLSFESLGGTASVVTTLPGGDVTESSTAGTALGTGYQNPVNGPVGMGTDGSIKKNLIDWANANGMMTAIVTTDEIGGPIAGAFGAHEPDARLTDAIRLDYLLADPVQGHSASKPRVLLGGGYNDPAVIPGTTSTYVGLATSLNYKFVTAASELPYATPPLLGLFGTSWGPMTPMAYRASDSKEPTLTQMVTTALQAVEGASLGFLVIVESANIDLLTGQDVSAVGAEVAELDSAVKAAVSWATANSMWGNTTIYVTSDRESGGLSLDKGELTWSSNGSTTANVPLFASWPYGLDGTLLDNTGIFFLVQDALRASRGGQPPIITDLSLSDVTETSATVKWTTFEPSSGALVLTGGGQTLTFTDSAWGNTHTIVCGGLAAGTSYALAANSADWLGNNGTASTSLRTVGTDLTAYVVADPTVGPGVLSGSVQGLAVKGEGATQTITENADGVGSGFLAQYTLQTWVPREQIDSITLQAAYNWTALDGTADGVLAYVRMLAPEGGYLWQQVTFPFTIQQPVSYVDAMGTIVVRLEDGASIKRERKDTLTVDALFGTVVKSSTAGLPAPTQPVLSPAVVTENPLAVGLGWSASSGESGYQVWRYATATGWKALGQVGSAATSFTDTTASSLTSYSYVVRAYNADSYVDSAPVSVTTPLVLSAPTNLKASAVKGIVNLSWTDNNASETGYELLRRVGATGEFVRLALLNANAGSYSDRAVIRGTTYYYQVRAIAGEKTGLVSNTAMVTVK